MWRDFIRYMRISVLPVYEIMIYINQGFITVIGGNSLPLGPLQRSTTICCFVKHITWMNCMNCIGSFNPHPPAFFVIPLTYLNEHSTKPQVVCVLRIGIVINETRGTPTKLSYRRPFLRKLQLFEATKHIRLKMWHGLDLRNKLLTT